MQFSQSQPYNWKNGCHSVEEFPTTPDCSTQEVNIPGKVASLAISGNFGLNTGNEPLQPK